MTRKLVAGGLVVLALVAGLGGVSAVVLASDHATRVPAAQPVPAADAQTDADAAVDLNNWQEARVTMPGSGSRPIPPRRR